MRHLYICMIILLSGCTYSINMLHTEGSATDMIDENQTASPNISPKLSMPLAQGLDNSELEEYEDWS